MAKQFKSVMFGHVDQYYRIRIQDSDRDQILTTTVTRKDGTVVSKATTKQEPQHLTTLCESGLRRLNLPRSKNRNYKLTIFAEPIK